MASFRRLVTPGATYFFTVVAQDRRPVLTDLCVLTALRAAMRNVQATLPFRPIAMVVLPDHLHCVWELPDGDGDFPRRWAIIKRIVSQRCRHLACERASASRERRREVGLWQRRFWEHRIRDEDDLRRHLDYVHINPLKHGLVSRVADWPHSSFHRFVRRGVLPLDWGGSIPLPCGKFGEP